MYKAVNWVIMTCLIFSVVLSANLIERPLFKVLASHERWKAVGFCGATILVPVFALVCLGGPLGVFHQQSPTLLAGVLCWFAAFGCFLGFGTCRRLLDHYRK
jgi:hypothetical protein